MQGSIITVKARLWNSTLVEDYPRVSHVIVASDASIIIPERYNIHQTEHEDDTATVSNWQHYLRPCLETVLMPT